MCITCVSRVSHVCLMRVSRTLDTVRGALCSTSSGAPRAGRPISGRAFSRTDSARTRRAIEKRRARCAGYQFVAHLRKSVHFQSRRVPDSVCVRAPTHRALLRRLAGHAACALAHQRCSLARRRPRR